MFSVVWGCLGCSKCFGGVEGVVGFCFGCFRVAAAVARQVSAARQRLEARTAALLASGVDQAAELAARGVVETEQGRDGTENYEFE